MAESAIEAVLELWMLIPCFDAISSSEPEEATKPRRNLLRAKVLMLRSTDASIKPRRNQEKARRYWAFRALMNVNKSPLAPSFVFA